MCYKLKAHYLTNNQKIYPITHRATNILQHLIGSHTGIHDIYSYLKLKLTSNTSNCALGNVITPQIRVDHLYKICGGLTTINLSHNLGNSTIRDRISTQTRLFPPMSNKLDPRFHRWNTPVNARILGDKHTPVGSQT